MTAAARALARFPDARTEGGRPVPVHAEERFVWFYTPVPRKGLTLKAMTEPQRKLAMNLLRSGLSESGYAQAETIRGLEDVLVELGGNPAQRDRELYYFSIFGEPGPKTTWGWRYEGHHLSQNWTVVNGTAMATTPQFFGANPAEVRQGTKKGLRALAAEEDLASSCCGRSMRHSGRRRSSIPSRRTTFSPPTPAKRRFRTTAAWRHAQMTAAQKAALLKLIEEHAGTQTDPIARDRLARAKDVAQQPSSSRGWAAPRRARATTTACRGRAS